MSSSAYDCIVYLLVGLISLVPAIWASSTFVFNGLPRTKISNSLPFYLIYAGLAASAAIASVGRGDIFLAAGTTVSSAIWITSQSFFLFHVVILSLWAITVKRNLVNASRKDLSIQILIPVNSGRSLIIDSLAVACLIVEWAVGAILTPPHENLVGWTAFYLFIPYVAVNVIKWGFLAYHYWKDASIVPSY